MKILRGIQRRVARRTRISIAHAFCNVSQLTFPEGFKLIRIPEVSDKRGLKLVASVMQSFGEQNELARLRFTHGDEFLGWQFGGGIVSFSCLTYRDREVDPVRSAEATRRAFLLNFKTSLVYRGQGLYTSLLLAIRKILCNEGLAEFAIEVNIRNVASARGIEKAEFLPFAEISFAIIFNRWNCVPKRTTFDPADTLLF